MFENLSDRLQGVMHKIKGYGKITEENINEMMREIRLSLLEADVNYKVVKEFTNNVKNKALGTDVNAKLSPGEEFVKIVKDELTKLLGGDSVALTTDKFPTITMLVGLQGSGKTTTIGKLANSLSKQGKKVILAAADTFRAAAIEQLTEWSNRAGVELIAGQEGGDPAAVVFDAINAAKARKADVLICDTAGRLHNKKNLMEELKKINRIIEREFPEAYRETLVVLDGTTGQNALAQAKQFNEVADISGIILTKLDGTAKGGIAIAIQSEMNIPVKYIGIGEKIEDLQKFDADSFVDALFEGKSEEE